MASISCQIHLDEGVGVAADDDEQTLAWLPLASPGEGAGNFRGLVRKHRRCVLGTGVMRLLRQKDGGRELSLASVLLRASYAQTLLFSEVQVKPPLRTTIERKATCGDEAAHQQETDCLAGPPAEPLVRQ